MFKINNENEYIIEHPWQDVKKKPKKPDDFGVIAVTSFNNARLKTLSNLISGLS